MGQYDQDDHQSVLATTCRFLNLSNMTSLLTRSLDLVKDSRFLWNLWQQSLKQIPQNKLNTKAVISTAITFDIEQDFGSKGSFKFDRAENFFKFIKPVLGKRPATFFIQANTVPKLIKQLSELAKYHELGLHSFDHHGLWGNSVWFSHDDALDYNQKKRDISKCLAIFEKHSFPKPRSFRAPNMVIDRESLQILADNKINFDSSFSSFRNWSLPFLQSDIVEIPVSSLAKPKLVSKHGLPYLDFQVFNIANLSRLNFRDWQSYLSDLLSPHHPPYLVFLAHSWDFKAKLFSDLLTLLEATWNIEYVTISQLGHKLEQILQR